MLGWETLRPLTPPPHASARSGKNYSLKITWIMKVGLDPHIDLTPSHTKLVPPLHVNLCAALFFSRTGVGGGKIDFISWDTTQIILAIFNRNFGRFNFWSDIWALGTAIWWMNCPNVSTWGLGNPHLPRLASLRPPMGNPRLMKTRLKSASGRVKRVYCFASRVNAKKNTTVLYFFKNHKQYVSQSLPICTLVQIFNWTQWPILFEKTHACVVAVITQLAAITRGVAAPTTTGLWRHFHICLKIRVPVTDGLWRPRSR